MKALVFTGARFVRWTVLDRVGTDDHNVGLWRVRCDCGAERVLRASVLTSKKSRSCGCYRAEQISSGHGQNRRGQRTQSYSVWNNMIQRCTNKDNRDYPNYGGRGIHVCVPWRQFPAFYTDMGDPSQADMTLERLDNNLGYQPGNCRWVTRGENLRNKRNNVYVEHNGKRQCLMDWSEELGIKHRTLYQRYAVGDRGAALFRVPQKGVKAN